MEHRKVPFSDYEALGRWVRERRGQVIACEAKGATWLPFQPLGSFKSSRGRADEVCYVRDDGGVP